METLDVINRLVVSFGLPTIAGVLIYAGRKLQKLDDMEKTIEQEIKPDLKNVRERFSVLEGKLSGATGSKSPISLTARGERILTESGMKEYIDQHKDQLIGYCQNNFKFDTAYDIQEAIFEYFRKLPLEPAFEKKLKEYAFNAGISLELERRIGAIYFRDICLKQFNKDAQELDA